MRPASMMPFVLMAAIGCGRHGFEVGQADAGGANVDAAPTFLGPFGAPTLVAELATEGNNDDPILSPDELTIFFTSTRIAPCAAWTSTRSSTVAPWQAPQLVPIINTGVDCDGSIAVTPDLLTLVFSSTRLSGYQFELFESTRPTSTSAWSVPQHLPQLGDAAYDGGPSLTDDGLLLVFTSDRDGDDDLYAATRATLADAWGAPTLIAELSTIAAERNAYVSGDGLELWFASDQRGSRDLWVARRPARVAPFGAPTRIDELASPDIEDDPWLSADARRLYFSRDSGAGSQIHVATR